MNIVDSSGWLEYFADAPNADFFAPALEDVSHLLVPSISVYEVFKRVYQQRGEEAALEAFAAMAQGQIIDLDTTLALNAAKLSATHKLPMADSIMLATAQAHQAILWTQDADFKNLSGVRYIEKKA